MSSPNAPPLTTGLSNDSNGFFIDSSIPMTNGQEMAIPPPLVDPTPLTDPVSSSLSANAIEELAESPQNQLTQYHPTAVSFPLSEESLSLIDSRKSTTKSGKKQLKSRPAFVTKLWTMVNDPSNQDLIGWYEDGLSFVVSDREMFVQKILPKFFKHSNFASFVRQLNMYGWHKVQDVSSGSLHSDNRWQFTNPNFQRGKPELLDQIARNKPADDSEQQEGGLNGLNMKMLLNELNSLKSNQLKISQELSRVRQDNELLWQELFTSREKNTLQNDKIEKILQFLASVYGNRVQVLEDDNLGAGAQVQPYTAYEYMDPQQQPRFQKPRLMIKQRHASNTSNDSINTTRISSVNDSPIQEIGRTPDLGTQDINQLLEETGASLSPADDMNGPQIKSDPSLDNLSRTIEQQGQSIDDIISKLQTQQYNDQPQNNFDLAEFLNQDLLPPDEDDKSGATLVTKPGTIREITDDGSVDEIIPPKKRRSSRR
jgi:heat shock transcription factor